jgi:trk system potassium uptake protein TrkA
MRIIIVGCGQVGAMLSYQLFKMGYQVVVIDQDEKAFSHLPEDFQGRLISGDVMTRTVLRRAEIHGADGLFALTNSDPLNALIAHIARSEYEVTTVAARNNDPRQLALQQTFGVTVIGTPGWRADSVVDLLSGEAVRAIRLDPNAELVIYKIVVPERWAGQNLDEFVAMERVEILKWERNGDDLLPGGPHLLVAGDQIYLKTEADVIETMRNRLESRQGQDQ